MPNGSTLLTSQMPTKDSKHAKTLHDLKAINKDAWGVETHHMSLI